MNRHQGIRVISVIRRGSSVPFVIETEAGRFLTKLHGSAQGYSALVAEIIVAELAATLGLNVPARCLVWLDETVIFEDRDAEIADLLKASWGWNLGFTYLERAIDFRPDQLDRVDPDLASQIVWLDILTMNPDRTTRNPNLLWWQDRLWLIDHGAALYFHHNWPAVREQSPHRILTILDDHLLNSRATRLADWTKRLTAALPRTVIQVAIEQVPEPFLSPLLPGTSTSDALERRRSAYSAFLWKRLNGMQDMIGSPLASPRD